jgi:NAD(P)-dependent dehydrogenase (short-subunit alcohol dehydrogenase family)
MSTTETKLEGLSKKLAGQKVLVIGASSGIGLATARLARRSGAELVLAALDEHKLGDVGRELEAPVSAFDVLEPGRVERFFGELDAPVDHVLLTGPGPYYARLEELDFERATRDVEAHLFLPLRVGREAVGRVRAGGTLLFMSAIAGRRVAPGLAVTPALTAAMPAMAKTMALELAPIRVNIIAAGFVDTPLSASVLGDQLDARRRELRDTLPIGRVVEPQDIAALAVHLMADTAVTGATFDIDGGEQLL